MFLGLPPRCRMTLRQAAFLETQYMLPAETRTPEKILSTRATGAKTGWLSKPKPRVIIDERSLEGWFPLIPAQHITTAAALDQKHHHETNPRCTPGNGPIPVDCRSGTCGTCWIGIVGGSEKLSPVDPSSASASTTSATGKALSTTLPRPTRSSA
jgi:ferredoxin